MAPAEPAGPCRAHRGPQGGAWWPGLPRRPAPGWGWGWDGPCPAPPESPMAQQQPPAHAASAAGEVVSSRFGRKVGDLHWRCCAVCPDTKLSSVNSWGIFIFFPQGQPRGLFSWLEMASRNRSTHSPTMPPGTTPGLCRGREVQLPILTFLGLPS